MKCIFLIIILLLTGCQSKSRFIHLNQGCLNGSDHYEVQFFAATDSCRYFKKHIKEYKKLDFFKTKTESKTIQSSALVINKSYYIDLIDLIQKYSQSNLKDCAIDFTIYNSKKKMISNGYILVKDYMDFKSEIQKLNVKYSIDEGNVARINWYFHMVDMGKS